MENTVFQEKDTDFKYLQYVSLVGIRNCNLYLTCLKPYKHQGGCPICYFQYISLGRQSIGKLILHLFIDSITYLFIALSSKQQIIQPSTSLIVNRCLIDCI